jgi:hypothetical protein
MLYTQLSLTSEGTDCRVKLKKQRNYRLTEAEDRGVIRAARAAGVTESQWLRLLVRVALGETALLEQLERVSRARKGRPRSLAVKKRRPRRTKGSADME